MLHCDVSWQGVPLMSRTTTAFVPAHMKFMLNWCLKEAGKMRGPLIRQSLSDIHSLSMSKYVTLAVWWYMKSLIATSWFLCPWGSLLLWFQLRLYKTCHYRFYMRHAELIFSKYMKKTWHSKQSGSLLLLFKESVSLNLFNNPTAEFGYKYSCSPED